MTTPADITTRFPQFSSADSVRIQFYIDDSAPWFDVCRWGKLLGVGQANWVAHYLTMDAYNTSLGVGSNAVNASIVGTKKVDTVTITKDPGMLDATAKEPMMRTIYGQEYLRLRRIIGMGALAV